MKPIFFLHVPKTAGTSIIELVSRNFRADECRRIVNSHLPAAEITNEIECALLEGAKFITGHISYDAISPLASDLQVFTFLRRPIPRLLSVYRFWRSQPLDQQRSPAAQFAVHLSKRLSFIEFIQFGHPVIVSATRNEMCKMLTGGTPDANPASDFTALARMANERLSAMPFGIVDDLEQSLRLLSHELNLNLEDTVHLNSTPENAPDIDLIPLEIEDTLARNSADMELFTAATALLGRKLRALNILQLYKDIGESALTSIRPQEGGSFIWDATMPLTGNNWHEREVIADTVVYRFTSSPDSTIYLPNPFDGDGFSIKIFVPFFHKHGLLQHVGPVKGTDSLKFTLDGEPVEASRKELAGDAAEFVIAAAPSAKRQRWLTLSIGSAYGVRPSLFDSPDQRVLAAAVSSITLSPADATP